MPSLKITGLDELGKKLKQNATLDDVKKVVRHNGARLQQSMQGKADFTRGYATGQTKRSIYLEVEDNGLTAKVAPETEYSPYLEYGTRFMTPQPFVNPAFNEVKTQFLSDMQKLTR